MKNKYYTLINRNLIGEATDKEKKLLKKLLNESEEHSKVFTEYQKLWNELTPPQPRDRFPVDKKWQELENTLGLKASETPGNIIPLFGWFTPKWRQYIAIERVAAIAASFILIFSLIFYLFNRSTDDWQVYSSRKAERKEIHLPDQSLVRLNVDSRIEYPEKFSDSVRVVNLFGEAFFEVLHEKRQFTIKTDNAKVRVLGTQFNVKARNQKTQVFVKNGKVVLQNNQLSADKGIVLTSNQMSTCIENLAPQFPQTVNSDNLLGWLENKIIFKKKPLREIAEELQRIFDIKIELSDANLDGLSVSGTFEEDDVESIVSSICLTLNLKYQYDSGIFRIFSK